uniref:Phlebovirus_G2 domain-containing protein n=1 Tax=Heterorhabditis bacteriophora TaxID=37862 RepID=A0A1I7W9K3_HETBA
MRFPFTIVLSLIILTSCDSCTEVSSIQTDSNSCQIHKSGSLECSYDTSTILTIPPNNQTMCLSLLDPKKQIIGSLKITIPPIRLLCRYKSLFFTRDQTFVYPSIKRCSLMGSCSNNFCETIQPDSAILEFSNEINNRTGFSYLTTSISLHINGQPVKTATLSLSPGHAHSWNNITFSIISTSLPSMPILGAPFLRDIHSNQVRMFSINPVGQPQAGATGQLQCPSQYDAEQSKCTFDPNVCQCHSSADTVNCQCTSFNHSELLYANEFVLPLALGDVNLRTDAHRIITADVVSSSTTQLQIIANNFKTLLKNYDSTCNVTASIFSGCYNCNMGAIGNITCFTDFGEIFSEITCEHHQFNIKCNPTGYSSQIVLHAPSAILKMECSLVRPHNNVSLTAEGVLQYIPSALLPGHHYEKFNIANYISGTPTQFFSLSSLTSFLKNLNPLDNISNSFTYLDSLRFFHSPRFFSHTWILPLTGILSLMGLLSLTGILPLTGLLPLRGHFPTRGYFPSLGYFLDYVDDLSEKCYKNT